jgi:hypothetical protein
VELWVTDSIRQRKVKNLPPQTIFIACKYKLSVLAFGEFVGDGFHPSMEG